jgi:hypothetical protein
MAQEHSQLENARQLTEEVMASAEATDPAHKLASALHLVIEVLSTTPTPASAEQLRAVYEQAAQATQQRGIVEATPPAAPIRSLASVPPGSYEAPRNQDGTVATSSASAPSLYEPLRNEDGSTSNG